MSVNSIATPDTIQPNIPRNVPGVGAGGLAGLFVGDGEGRFVAFGARVSSSSLKTAGAENVVSLYRRKGGTVHTRSW